jgi:hypothetical protein
MDDTVRTHGSRESFDADVRWRGENLSYSNGYVNPVAASIHGCMESRPPPQPHRSGIQRDRDRRVDRNGSSSSNSQHLSLRASSIKL